MPITAAQSAPGNRIKFNNNESDVIDRLTGESGNRYLVLGNPDDPNAGLRIVNEAYVGEHDETEYVSTIAEARDPDSEYNNKPDTAELDRFRQWEAQQRSAKDAVQTAPPAEVYGNPDKADNNPTDPTDPTPGQTTTTAPVPPAA